MGCDEGCDDGFDVFKEGCGELGRAVGLAAIALPAALSQISA